MTSPAGRPAAERWLDPTKLLRELGILRPDEIDVEAIAEYVGATVVYEELRGCGGGLVARGDRAIITADRRSPRPEQRLAVAHELAHWILDRGESGLVPSDPLGVYVSWFDDEGYEEDVTPEERADGWAAELLLPETMLWRELRWDGDEPRWGTAMTFCTVRDVCRRYNTPFLTTAERVVRLSDGNTLLVRNEPGEVTEYLRHNDTEVGDWLHKSPLQGTVAYDLLHGDRESPRKGAGATASGATTVGSDGWLRIPTAWWCPASEDSMLTEDGKVLSLLSWPGDAMSEMCGMWPKDLLPREPGVECAELLAGSLAKAWGYYPVAWADGELVMETLEPSRQRVVIPRTGLDAERIRGLVTEVARQKEVMVDEVLVVMMD